MPEVVLSSYIHNPLLSIYLVSLTIYFPHLAGIKKKIFSKSLFASSQSTCIYAFYTWLPSSLLSLFYETASLNSVAVIWRPSEINWFKGYFHFNLIFIIGLSPSVYRVVLGFSFSEFFQCLEIQKQLDFPILQGPEFLILSIFIFPLKSATSCLSSCFLKYIPKAASSQTHTMTFSRYLLQVHYTLFPSYSCLLFPFFSL